MPRKGVKFDLKLAINQIDLQLATQGITTMFHSLTMANSTICNNVRTIKPDDIFTLSKIIKKTNELLIRHKIHIRLELNTLDIYDSLIFYLNNNLIDELSFMDHTPGQGQYKDLSQFRKVIIQQYGNITLSEQDKIIEICSSKEKLNLDKINYLIQVANNHNVPLAYHDVDNNSLIDWMKENNIRICEFPLDIDTAKYSISNKLYNVVGSPNILLGKSHYNNVSAITLIKENLANILVSDYFSPSLLISIFKLYDDKILTLPNSVKLATLNPAKALGISDKYGSIEKNKKADIIIIDNNYNIPKVIMTIINGIIKYQANFQ